MDVNHLLIFKKVVDSGGFSVAASDLGIPKSSVSRKVSQLEQDLGVRLLQRTTRRVSVTEIGEKIYEAAVRIEAEAAEIRSSIGETHEAPTGVLRVTAPHDLGGYVVRRMLKPFRKRFPKVIVEMDLSSRYVDLVKEGFDVALRASEGPLKESTLVAKSLLTTRLKVYASPSWIKEHGKPTKPQDLENAQVALFMPGMRRTPNVWRLVSAKGDEVDVSVSPALRTNDFLTIKEAVLGGVAIALLPELVVLTEVERQEIVPLLRNWESGRASFYAVYPSRRHVPAKTKAFIAFLQAVVSHDHMPSSQ